MKDAWPVEAKAVGGRHYRGDYIDQNFDAYAVEYTFADGSAARPVHVERLRRGIRELCSQFEGLSGDFECVAHAARGGLYRNQKMTKENLVWRV
ncbi:MAG: hypothetical protein U0903_19885 [Planctomycetales bacterium]